jgi:hypothetical protein
MKKLLAGGLALGFVGVGTALLAVPGGAQEEGGFDFIETLDANLTPTTVQGGGTVTVTSVDPCPGTDEVVEPFTKVVWGYGDRGWLNQDTFEGEVYDEGEAALNEDGSWTVTFQAISAPGDYEFFAVCATDGVAVTEDAAGDAEAAVAEAAEVLGGDHGDGDECPEPQTLGGDHGGDECPPEPCPDPVPLGGDHGGSSSTPTTECPPPSSGTTAPPSSSTTAPPPEIGIWLYGPEAFTVTAGAAPVPEEPPYSG